MAQNEEKRIRKSVEGIHWISSALLVSAVLAVVFLQHTFVLAQDAKQLDMLGSPNSFAGWPSALLALYVFFAGQRLRYKFGAVIILSVLVTCVLIWFFGLTSAGESLRSF